MFLPILKAGKWLLSHLVDVFVMAYRVRRMVTNDLPHLEADVKDTRREVREHIAFCRGVRSAGGGCPVGEGDE